MLGISNAQVLSGSSKKDFLQWKCDNNGMLVNEFLFYSRDFSEYTTNLDTSKVSILQATFQNTRLDTIDLSTWDTSNVQNFHSTFRDSEVRNLNISSWVFKEKCFGDNFMKGCNNLETLVTPAAINNPSFIITLPKTMYDTQGNQYTQLDSTTPTQTTLTSTYTPTVPDVEQTGNKIKLNKLDTPVEQTGNKIKI